MANPASDNQLLRLWRSLTQRRPQRGRPSSRSSSIAGNRVTGLGTAARYSVLKDLPEIPVRPFMGDLDNSRDLLEVATYSLEARHGCNALARDCFQERYGRVGSWTISKKRGDGSAVHPDTLSAARDLAARYYGKTPVLGGNRLQRAALDALTLGTSFLELGIERDGKGYTIARSRYWPTFSAFREYDDDNELAAYRQQLGLRPDSTRDPLVNPVKMLQFSYGGRDDYGMPITYQSLDCAWFKLKEAAANLERATTAVGVNPWLHVMPEGKDNNYREDYKQRYESLLKQGVVTNLFLLHGADVKKAAASNPSLSVLFDAVLQYRFQMIPPGVPVWLFPGLNVEVKGGKEIANQPALTYARMIADLRAMLGEQIKWAIMLEIVCRHFDRGYDALLKDGLFDFDVVWPQWDATTLESVVNAGDSDDNSQQSETPDEELDRTLKQAESLLEVSSADDASACSKPEAALLLAQLLSQQRQIGARLPGERSRRLDAALASLTEVVGA